MELLKKILTGKIQIPEREYIRTENGFTTKPTGKMITVDNWVPKEIPLSNNFKDALTKYVKLCESIKPGEKLGELANKNNVGMYNRYSLDEYGDFAEENGGNVFCHQAHTYTTIDGLVHNRIGNTDVNLLKMYLKGEY